MAAKTHTTLGGGLDTTVVDKRRTSITASVLSNNYGSESAMNSALATAGYTDAQVDVMTFNDKMYAVRLANDSAGI